MYHPFIKKFPPAVTIIHRLFRSRVTSRSFPVHDILASPGCNSEYKYLRRQELRRFDGECFFGKRFYDSTLHFSDSLIQLKEQVRKLLQESEAEPVEFLEVAYTVVNCLSDSRHVPYELQVHKDLLCIGTESPFRPFLDKALMKCFRTAWNAVHEHRENFSGWALAGARGTGKSNITRLVALLSGLLLPNFQSVFVAAADIHNLSITEAIRCAALEAGIVPDDNSKYNLGSVIGSFTQSNCAIGVFVDELPVEYKPDDTNWRNIHTLAGATEYTFVLVNGGASILPAMVKADLDDFPMLRQYIGGDNASPLQSLNPTKLKIEFLPRFSTEQHYFDYFKHLGVGFLRNPCQLLVHKAHIFSGGILRSLREELPSYTQSYSVLLQRWRHKYPNEKTLAYKIFSVLAEKYLKSAFPQRFNVFNMPMITEADLLRVIIDFGSDSGDLQKLVADGTLDVVKSGITTEYTYGLPAHFLASLHNPIIFISHWWSSATINTGTHGLLKTIIEGSGKEIIFVVCEDAISQEVVDNSIRKWQNCQSIARAPREYCNFVKRVSVALIDDPYLKRLEEFMITQIKNECADEFENILEQHCKNSSCMARVVMVTDSSLPIDTIIKRLEMCFPQYAAAIRDFPYYQHDREDLQGVLKLASDHAVTGYPNLEIDLVLEDVIGKKENIM